MMISTVKGHFENYTASIEASEDDFSDASFSFSTQTGSINTKNKDRDTHLKSDDFFNVNDYPEMSFVSTSFDGEHLTGYITIRDITKEITLDVDFNGVAVDPYGQTKAGFEMRGKINRTDFNLTWNAVTEAGSVVVSDTVNIVIDAQFIKQ